MHELRSTILSGDTRPSSPVARKAKPKSEAAAPGGLSKIAIKRQEARVTDQRLEDRHFGLVERSTIQFRRRRYDVDVVNVSSRGAMIVADIEPRIGEKLDIQLGESNRTRCIVRWVRDGRVGLEFVDETIFWETGGRGPVFHYEKPRAEAGAGTPVHVAVDREPRQTLLRAGTLYWSGISIPVRLRNISEGGARVESGRELCPGAEVELDLGGGNFAVAEVRWSKDGQVGLRFAEAFDIESLAPAHASEERPPEVLKPAYLETELQPDSPWAARFERLSLTDLKGLDSKA
ncbi:MAG TPA: PilZ domain-containing protein [Allosphingosinicella sp.]|nr:PilZ domain-containing protein [Allosphingosinicella sp.]